MYNKTNQYYDVTQTVLLDGANKFRQTFEVDRIIREVFLSDHVVNVTKLHILNGKTSTEKRIFHVRTSFWKERRAGFAFLLNWQRRGSVDHQVPPSLYSEKSEESERSIFYKRSIKGAKLNVLRKFFFLYINRIKSQAKRQNSITMSTKKFSEIWGFGWTFPYATESRVSMETERAVTHLWKIVFAHVLYQSFHRLNFVVSPTR